jgi:hypothetical protein
LWRTAALQWFCTEGCSSELSTRASSVESACSSVTHGDGPWPSGLGRHSSIAAVDSCTLSDDRHRHSRVRNRDRSSSTRGSLLSTSPDRHVATFPPGIVHAPPFAGLPGLPGLMGLDAVAEDDDDDDDEEEDDEDEDVGGETGCGEAEADEAQGLVGHVLEVDEAPMTPGARLGDAGVKAFMPLVLLELGRVRRRRAPELAVGVPAVEEDGPSRGESAPGATAGGDAAMGLCTAAVLAVEYE